MISKANSNMHLTKRLLLIFSLKRVSHHHTSAMYVRRTNRECLILLEGFVPPFTPVNLSNKLKLFALAQLRKSTEHAKLLNLETVSMCFSIFCAS